MIPFDVTQSQQIETRLDAYPYLTSSLAYSNAPILLQQSANESSGFALMPDNRATDDKPMDTAHTTGSGDFNMQLLMPTTYKKKSAFFPFSPTEQVDWSSINGSSMTQESTTTTFLNPAGLDIFSGKQALNGRIVLFRCHDLDKFVTILKDFSDSGDILAYKSITVLKEPLLVVGWFDTRKITLQCRQLKMLFESVTNDTLEVRSIEETMTLNSIIPHYEFRFLEDSYASIYVLCNTMDSYDFAFRQGLFVYLCKFGCVEQFESVPNMPNVFKCSYYDIRAAFEAKKVSQYTIGMVRINIKATLIELYEQSNSNVSGNNSINVGNAASSVLSCNSNTAPAKHNTSGYATARTQQQPQSSLPSHQQSHQRRQQHQHHQQHHHNHPTGQQGQQVVNWMTGDFQKNNLRYIEPTPEEWRKYQQLKHRRLASLPFGFSYIPQENQIDITRIERGLDNRKTLMIRNIPNKINHDELKEFVDATSKDTYEFLYLRIDFENHCNVGYAFISFTDPKHIIRFYIERAGKKWNKFNSEKVCELSYARVQGRAKLIEKFRNSKVMDENPAYRPRLYHTEGPFKGTEIDFPPPTRREAD